MFSNKAEVTLKVQREEGDRGGIKEQKSSEGSCSLTSMVR